MKLWYCLFVCIFLLVFGLTGTLYAQTTYTSTSSGNWSFMTWSPAGTPGPNDDVIVADGHTVTINQNIAIRNLTVGGGTSGTLQFDGTTGREVIVSGNLTVSTGGSFILYPALTPTGDLTQGSNLITNVSSTAGVSALWYIYGVGIKSAVTISSFTANSITMSDTATLSGTGVSLVITPPLVDSMYIGGDLVNNGRFDMTVGSDTARCNIIFNKTTGDQTISGTGATTRFRAVRLAKGAIANKVICSSDVTMANPSILYTAGTWEQTAGWLNVTAGSINVVGPGLPPLANTARLNLVGTGSARIPGNLNISGNFLLNTNDSLIVGSGGGKIDLTTTSGSVGVFTKGTVCVYGKFVSASSSDLTIDGANIIIDPKGMGSLVPPTDEYIFRTTTGGGSTPFTFTAGTVTILNPNLSPISTREEINLNSSVAPVITGNARFVIGQGANTLGSPKGFRIRNNSKAVFSHLTIDADTGTVHLLSAVNVNGELRLNSGRIDLAGMNLILGDTARLLETSGTTIAGTGGTVKTTRILNAPSSANDIAGLGIMIGSSANLDTTTISRGVVAQVGAGNAGIKRYYNILPKNNSGLNATVRFRYDSTEAVGFDETNLIVFASISGDSVWVSPGVPARNPLHRTLSISGLDSLTRLTAGDINHPLGNFASLQTVELSMNARWNLVSLPVVVADPQVKSLFPSAISNAFAYEGTYVVKTSLAIGGGYWLKFSDAPSIQMTGGPIQGLAVPVVKGWNLIGSPSSPILVSSIASEPAGIFSSGLFEYISSYKTVDTIKPGKGYWIKVSSSGTLLLSTVPPSPSARIRIVPTNEMPPSPPSETEGVSKGQIPDHFVLDQNFPNPFNPTTKITFGLPVASMTTLSVFNLLGQEVAQLLNGTLVPAGTTSVNLDASSVSGGLPSGLYFYKLTAIPVDGSGTIFSSIKKMMLVK